MLSNYTGASSYKCINMIDPVNDQDYATKKYHDDNKAVAGDLNLADLNEKSYNSLTDTEFFGVGKESDDLIHSNDLEAQHDTDVMTKIKEIQVYECLSGFRHTFEMRNIDGSAAYARVYVNGVAVGAEWQNNGSTFQEKIDDLTNLKSGDLLQVYGRVLGASGEKHIDIQNQRIYFIKFINNDPV